MIESISQLGLTFFGLSYDTISQSRAAVFKQIHQIVFHGKGGYDWETIYNMPIWLRRFTFNEIHQYYEEEKNSYNKSSNPNSKTVIGSDGKVNSPEFLSKIKSTPTKKSISYK
jgi:hypothetical protein